MALKVHMPVGFGGVPATPINTLETNVDTNGNSITLVANEEITYENQVGNILLVKLGSTSSEITVVAKGTISGYPLQDYTSTLPTDKTVPFVLPPAAFADTNRITSIRFSSVADLELSVIGSQ